MGRWSRPLLTALGLMLAVSCSPIAAGPELPRPAQPHALASPTTVPVPTTTTTLDEMTMLASGCPTEICLLYTIADEARWSDGEPVTAEDFVATVSAHKDPLASGRDPTYDLVTQVEPIDARTVRVALSRTFGTWQSLFSRLIPAHAESLDVTEMPVTGPFVVSQWVPGDRIVVERNPHWWTETDPLTGSRLGTIERIDFVFLSDTEELLGAIEGGEVDLAVMRPSAEILEQLDDLGDSVVYASSPGPFWEHIDFHHEDEMLSRPWVREMFHLAIDRDAILDETVRRLAPTASPLNNSIWMSYSDNYESHYEDRYDPAAAEQLLIDNGCARDGEVYECDGRAMSFVWLSTNDDPDRRAVLEAVRDDLGAIGVEIVPNLRAPSDFVTRDVLFGGPDVWQLANFSWRAGSDPATAEATYLCGDSDLNVNRYCSPEVESMVREAATEMDPDARADLLNEADGLYLSDLALIPLYQKPELLVWSAGLQGPTANFTRSTEMWNVASWTGDTSVAVAIPSEPVLDPLATGDESADRVLATLLYGAFGMDPSLNHLPVLIESVEILER